MSNQHEESVGPAPSGVNIDQCFTLFDHIHIPDELIEMCLCQEDKGFITDDRIKAFVYAVMLPTIKQTHSPAMDLQTLQPCAFHVHVSTRGLTPHNHLPHVLTSILYLTDAEGDLIVYGSDGSEFRVHPKAGRMVVMHGSMMHAVEPSHDNQLRMSLVASYEYPGTQAVPTALPNGSPGAY